MAGDGRGRPVQKTLKASIPYGQVDVLDACPRCGDNNIHLTHVTRSDNGREQIAVSCSACEFICQAKVVAQDWR